MTRNAVVQAAILIIAACVLAVVTNGFASRQRRLVLPGYYPDARQVPPRQPEKVAPAPVTATAAAPAAPSVIPTATATSATTTLAPQPSTTPVASGPVPTATAAAVPVPAPLVEEDPLKRFPPHPDKAYIEIAGDDVIWLYGKGALFLDARRTSVFEQAHIAGARPFSVWESDVDEKVAKLFEERSDPREQNRPIVIYCSGGACEDSHMLAQKLWGVQFNNVYVYKDGFPDWQKRGGAVRAGAQP